MIKHIIAISFIFGCAAIAWAILGATVDTRTTDADRHSRAAVGQLWGGPHVQHAPRAYLREVVERTVEETQDGQASDRVVTDERLTPLPIESSRVRASLSLEHRRKGLLWHPTFEVHFRAEYTVRNPTDGPAVIRMRQTFPEGAQVFDDFEFSLLTDSPGPVIRSGEVVQELELEPDEEASFTLAYRSQGMNSWKYAFGGSVEEVRDFRLELHTDFQAIDFLPGTLSPGARERTADGWLLRWDYGRLVADAGIGIDLPERLNPGPWVSRVTFFAPVSLFLFFFLMFVITIVRDVRLHPMHYFFLAAAFFSFHLLLAYLVDHISVHLAVSIASVTSLALVISYMRLVVNLRFALIEVGLAQAVYLVGFAYTFFLEGATGLAVTILTIVTLFVVMQATGRVDWNRVFQQGPASRPLEVT